MKKVTLLVAAVLCSLGSFAQEQYPINWDKDANLTFTRSGDRQTSSVSITVNGEQQTIDVLSKSNVVYRDFSDQTFTVQPGDEIVPSMAYAGEWMHGYVYLDTNNNGAFDVNGYEDQNDELVAFSFYSPYDSSNGVNGIGESKSNNCNVNPMNAFKAPEKPGQYRMRYIIDWNCIDPAGQYGSNYSSNFINANGGVIVDVTLVVEGAVEPEPPVVVDPVEYGPVLLSAGDNLVNYKIHNLGADDGSYKGNDCYVKYVEEKAGNWNSLWHTDAAEDADNFAFFAAEDGGVFIKDVTANKFVTWKQNAEGGINWGSHQLTACQVTLVDAMADAKSWFIADDENTEGRYDILPVEGANNGWSFMGGIDQDFVVLNLEKKTDRNIKWVFEQVEEETPVDPEPPVVEPEELTWSPVSNGNTYAIVNLQPTETNYYLNYVDGNLSTIDATECNSLYEWPETAKFQAVELADGRFAFKNIGTGNYLAWKGTANRNNTTGAYNNCGYNPEINEMSSWTMNESTRFEGGYWFRAEQRNEIPNDGANLTGTFVIGNDGAWNAWTDGECTMATFSNTFGFVLLEEGETPVDPEPPVEPEPEYNYAEEVAPVLAEANAALEGHDHVYNYNYTYGDALLTEASQFSSPFSQNDLGSKDGQNLSDGCLIDNNGATFWHSVWSQGNKAPHSHYLDVVLPEAIDGDLVLTFVRRNAANDQVTRFDVESSIDGVNYTHAAYIDMPNSGAGKTETKEFALEQKAQYLRFWADATTNNRGYWHCAEFQLNQKFTEVELLVDAPDYAYPEAVAALQEAIAKAQAVENGTKEDVDALAAAVEAYKAALAGYPEFTEWTGDVQVNAGDVTTIDDLLNVDFCFNRALTAEASAYGVLGVVYDHTGDAYALAFDALFGGVEVEQVKADGFVGNVAHVQFEKIADLAEGLQGKAKGVAAKVGGFQTAEGHATVVLASKSFLVDGEKYNAIVKADYELATGTVTGIENLIMNAKGEIIDLQGRRVNAAQNGIFIQNGKKVLR